MAKKTTDEITPAEEGVVLSQPGTLATPVTTPSTPKEVHDYGDGTLKLDF